MVLLPRAQICCEISEIARARRAGDSNPEALARGGFQVLMRLLHLAAAHFTPSTQPIVTLFVITVLQEGSFCGE